MSKIADRIGSRYDAIVEYFVRHPFGTHPPDMTVLSLLPPEDRCLILERLFRLQSGNVLDLVDKLSMAYLKAGWSDLAKRFVVACVKGGWIVPEHGAFFFDKLSTLLVHGVSEGYADTFRKLPQYEALAPELGMLIRTLCETYSGRELFANVSLIRAADVVDLQTFIAERESFVRWCGGELSYKDCF